jgi:hypothetical protein
MSEPLGRSAEVGGAEIGSAEIGQGQAASVTFITPGTGALAAVGQPAHSRPIHAEVGALAITGQQPRLNVSIIPQTGALATAGQPASVASLSTIVSAEYTGDGSSPRAFESLGTVPLVVFVFGKDGSGNLVGAIKTGTMPSGKSQPMEVSQASGASARSNRILDFTANGFTVGSDLNVTGRKYAYIIFPAGLQTTVTTRSFVAPGGKPEVNSTLSVPSGAGTISGTNCFTSTGDEASGWVRPSGNTVYSAGIALVTAGRRAIRNSDGAVLCEVTGAIDANSASGVGYIAGNIGGTLWHWEEYYVDLLGQVCDMILLMADDTGGTSPGVPLTVIKPSEMATSNGDWAGTGFGELDVFLASDTDKALHVKPRASGGAPALTKGTTYHVVTFHDDEANTGIKLHTFTWTGTGPLGTPPTLAGMDFKPDWAFVYNSSNSFTWSKNSSNILGTNLRDRGWIDGGGDSATNALVSWDSGGVTLAAGGDWNGNGVKYLGIFFIANPVVTGPRPSAGALALTGQQATVRVETRITPNTGALSATGQPATVTSPVTRTPSAGALQIVGQTPIVRQEIRIAPQTGSLSAAGQQPVLDSGVVPSAGALDLTGETPTLIVRQTVFITPQTGALTVTGQQPRQGFTVQPGTGAITAQGSGPGETTDFLVTPFTGELNLQGHEPIVRESSPGDHVITPGTGALNFVGQQATVEQITPTPPTPPVPSQIGGGIGLPHPRRLPFWPTPARRVARVEVHARAAAVDVRASAGQNVLALLELLDI